MDNGAGGVIDLDIVDDQVSNTSGRLVERECDTGRCQLVTNQLVGCACRFLDVLLETQDTNIEYSSSRRRFRLRSLSSLDGA